MQRCRLAAVGAMLSIMIVATAAPAQVEVGLAFDPPVAMHGDQVILAMSLENTGTEDVTADLQLAIVWREFEFPVMTHSSTLRAGVRHGGELPFYALRFFDGLHVTLSATVGETTSTASATLTVTGEPWSKATNEDARVVNELAENLATVLAGDDTEVPTTEQTSFGDLKQRYR